MTDIPSPDGSATAPKPSADSFLRRRVITPILDQVRQGVSPGRLAAALAVGALLGIFPIIGSSTLLCVIVGAAARLNQPAMQVANYLVYPLQIPLVFAFVRLGETIIGAPHVTFSVPQLMREFSADPVAFMRQFGITGLHGIFAWSILAGPLTILLFFALRPLLVAAARKVQA